jgi:ribose transport system substrate-binding protein
MKLKLFLLIAVSLFITACAKQGDDGTAAPAKKKIGVSLLARSDVFYKDMESAMKAAAEANGFAIDIQDGEKDLAKQQAQIDNFIAQKVDAIIVCPTDTQGIAPAIERANAAGIPVFTADIAASGNGKVVAHVASDNVFGGRLAGDFVVKALGGEGKVAVIGHPEVQSVIDREKGFKDVIAGNPKMTLLPTVAAGGVRDRALKAAEDILQGNPDVKAIFCINDESALGALQAIEAKGVQGVTIVGFDAAPEAVGKIRAGTALKASVAQQPNEIGKMTVEAIAKHLKGEKVDATIAVPVTLVQ